MKSAVIAILSIAALLLAFVLTMGVFFAVIRPSNSAISTYHNLDDYLAIDYHNQYEKRPHRKQTTTSRKTNPTTTKTFTVTTTKILPSRIFYNPTTTVTQTTIFHRPTTTEPQATRQWQPMTSVRSRTLDTRQRLGLTVMLGNADQITMAPTRQQQQQQQQQSQQHIDDLKLLPFEDIHERRVDYDKIVGLAVDSNARRLYAASHRSGEIAVLSTPTLELIDRIACPGCRIYDIDVLHNGEHLVIAQGKNRRLSLLDAHNGSLLVDIQLDYETKGVTVDDTTDTIYVLSRAHDTIYKYNGRQLTPTGRIAFINAANDDCNFIRMANTLIYVSCQSALMVIDQDGLLVHMLQRPQISYSLGVAIDTDGRVLTVRRGKTQLDVYDTTSADYLITIGEPNDALWSDLVVDDMSYAYVVDYFTTTIMAMKMPEILKLT